MLVDMSFLSFILQAPLNTNWKKTVKLGLMVEYKIGQVRIPDDDEPVAGYWVGTIEKEFGKLHLNF
jgi:hypothetical protein